MDSKNGTSGVPPPSTAYTYTFKPSPEYLKGRPKKLILTVDGGGLRGMIPARLLEELEVVVKEHIMSTPELYDTHPAAEVAAIKKGEFNIHLADFFDVMSGTSTGSIITAYLASKGDLSHELLNGDEDVTALDQQQVVKLTPEEQAKKKKGDGETMSIEVDFNPNGDAQMRDLLDRFQKGNLVPGSCRAIQAMFVAKANRIFPKDRIERYQQKLEASGLFEVLKKIGEFPGQVQNIMKVRYGEEGINDTLKKAFKSPTQPLTTGEEPGMLSNSLHTSLIIPTIQLDKARTVSFFYHHDTKQQGYATLRRAATKEEQEDGDMMARRQYPNYMDSKAVKNMEEGLQLSGTPDLIYCINKDFELWQVVRSSTAAPTFFPPCQVTPYKIVDQKREPIADEIWHMSDGGVTSNNPGMSAVVFASAIYDTVESLEDLAVFSLGCGTQVAPVKVKQNDGVFGWGSELIDLLMNGNQELSSALVEHFVTFPYKNNQYKNQKSQDPSDRFVRIQKTADLTAVEYATGSDGKKTVVKDPTGATETVKIGKAKEAKVADLLGGMDDAACVYQYHELAERMLKDESLKIKAQMQTFVRDFVLPPKKTASISAKEDDLANRVDQSLPGSTI